MKRNKNIRGDVIQERARKYAWKAFEENRGQRSTMHHKKMSDIFKQSPPRFPDNQSTWRRRKYLVICGSRVKINEKKIFPFPSLKAFQS